MICMRLIQKLSSLTAVALLISLFVAVTSAFADDSSSASSSPTGASSVTSSTYDTSVTSSTYDGSMTQIDSLYNQILSLRQQEKDLDVQMKAQHDSNNAAIKALFSQISKSDLDQIKAVQEQNKDLRDANKSLYANWKSLNEQLRNARTAKDEKLVVELRLQINGLKKQLQPIQVQMKANYATIKDVIARVNAARKQIHDELNSIKPLEQQMKTLWSTERSYQAQRIAGWKAFNDAVNNGDTDSAVQALTQIVTAKQQILNTRQQIYSLEQQIGTALNASLATITNAPASK